MNIFDKYAYVTEGKPATIGTTKQKRVDDEKGSGFTGEANDHDSSSYTRFRDPGFCRILLHRKIIYKLCRVFLMRDADSYRSRFDIGPEMTMRRRVNGSYLKSPIKIEHCLTFSNLKALQRLFGASS